MVNRSVIDVEIMYSLTSGKEQKAAFFNKNIYEKDEMVLYFNS